MYLPTHLDEVSATRSMHEDACTYVVHTVGRSALVPQVHLYILAASASARGTPPPPHIMETSVRMMTYRRYTMYLSVSLSRRLQKHFFNFSFSRERRNQQQEPHLTPSQPASQPVSPACPAQCRERATSQKQKGREGKGRRLTREDGRRCATRFRKASSHVVVRACMRACAVSLLLFIPGYYCLSAVRAQDGTCISLAKTRASPKKKAISA